MIITQAIGAVAGACFAYCGVPAAYRFWKIKTAPKEIGATAMLICVGGILMWTYLFLTYGWNWLLTINYFVEVSSWTIVIYFWSRK